MGDAARDCFALLACVVGLSVLAAGVIAAGVVPAAEQVHALISLNRRLHSAECHVTGHVNIADDIRGGRPQYLAGLLVDFETKQGLVVVNATALVNIEPERAWLTAADRWRLYKDHPVGSTLQCTYDDQAPHAVVATSPHITDYGSRVTLGVLSTMAMSAVALLAAAPVVLLGLYVCAFGLFYTGRRFWRACPRPLSLRPYFVLNRDGSDAPTSVDPIDQQL